ncbi:MAG: flagellar hook-associated protein FlgK [Phenylobacterium sp.]|uniref:flagellar hook-associated protein FlgK n=1 Tax=Phenylobacterium sp. TaxID=1871053 RepID=UPI003918E519
MSLSIAMKTATSGLVAAQTALRTVSDNIANVNTPGYVRKTVDQSQLVVDGRGMGVEITGIKRVTDQYLQLATLTASSDSKRWDITAQYLDNAQSLFGDPSGDSFFFTRLDDIWSAFAAAADDPSSSLLRGQSVSTMEDFLSEAGRINNQISELGRTVDAQITADIDRVNDLLEQINNLNTDISRANLVNADGSGAENIQSRLVDELATLMNVQVSQRAEGGVTIRSTEGFLLAGDGASRLTYNRTDATKGYVSVEPLDGSGRARAIEIASGELRGLMDLRDTELPGLADQLGEFVARASEEINRAHNAATAVPAPATLTGRNTGLDDPTVFDHFTGQTTVAIVDSAGVVTRRVDIDFDAGTMTVDGAPGPAFTPATFLTGLQTALGGAGTASFTDGKLSISANSGGVAVDEGTSDKAGRGFSHFFGLNDVIRSTGMTTYETGLTGTDPHGFIPGETITFRLAQGDGKPLRDITVTVPAAGDMNSLISALNDNTTGVGLYGQFALDSKGQLGFTGTPPTSATLSVVRDQTHRGASGPSISVLFGVGTLERTRRANNFYVDSDVVADPTKLAFAKLDLSVGAGQPAIRPGDGTGALGLSQAGDVTAAFSAAGALGAVNMTLTRYASEFGGSIGRKAAAAETRKDGAAAVMTEAAARRESVEGVNIDEELVRLTTYQQAFSASARLIQAADELIDTLVNMI